MRSAIFMCFVLCAAVCQAQSLLPFTNDAGLFDPSKESLKVGYQLFKQASEVEVRITDFRGQVANRFIFVDLRAGDQVFEWDGKNDNGETVSEGRYKIEITAQFPDGTRDKTLIDVMVAIIEAKQGVQVPEPLPPETHPYQVLGNISTFSRFSEEEDEDDYGEVRVGATIEYEDERQTVRTIFQGIQDFDGSSVSLDGSQAMAEQRWDSGKAKEVFRDNLGSFEDPFHLFSDFKTERNKAGVSVDQQVQDLSITGLVFTTEGDVDSQEQGAASRLVWGRSDSLMLGVSYTYRKAIEDIYAGEREVSQAAAVDVSFPISERLSFASELVSTDDDVEGRDMGWGLKGEYDFGSLRFSAGYTDLGEDFKASFSDPLHHVESDARGFDAGIDYFMQEPLSFLTTFSATLRFFNLTRHSDNSEVNELDGSVRLGLLNKDTLFISLYSREDEFGTNTNFMGSFTHKWNEIWSNQAQFSYAETDTSDSTRFTFNTTYSADITARLSIEWMQRTIDYSKYSPYDQTYVRFDISNDQYHLQLQGKYSENGEQSGTNVFGRIDYTIEFLHRYQLATYVSFGDRAAIETQTQFEIGIEVQF